jgi:hypothetical protein
VQVPVKARVAGENEVRLYYVPHFGTSFAVEARAAVSVTPAAK